MQKEGEAIEKCHSLLLRQVNLSSTQILHINTLKNILLTFVVPIATQSTGQQSDLKFETHKKMLLLNKCKIVCEHK